MSQTACKIISLLISCTLLFVCVTGCGNNGEKKYRSLFEKGIVIVNGIQIRTIQMDVPSGCWADYFEIDGLKNQKVEDQINSKIKRTMDEMQKDEFIPPYRGISLKLKQYSDLSKTYHLNISPQFNSNNILSVLAACYMWFTDESGSTEFSYSYVIPMNFDLSTGEELALSDFFAPRTDYIEMINRNVDKYLLSGGFDGGSDEYGGYSTPTLVSPFKGIKPDQKFLLDSEGNLRLYFDYDTPAFYSYYHPSLLTLISDEFDGDFISFRAVGQQLYKKEEKLCRFMSQYNEKSETKSENTDTGRNFYGRYKYLEGTPEKIIKQVETLSFDNEKFPLSDDALKKKAAKKLGKKKGFNISTDVSTSACFNKSRDYYSFIRQINYSVSTDDAWTPANPNPDYFSCIYKTAYCFDSSGKSLEYRSLFKQPKSADDLLKKTFLSSLSKTAEEMERDGIEWRDDQAQQLVEKALGHINGVALEPDSLSLSYDISFQELEDMIADCLGISENIYSVINCLLLTSYSDIGCENLVFFNEAFE